MKTFYQLPEYVDPYLESTKNIDSREELKEPTSGIMIDKVDKELNETMKVLKKYFPNIDIELTHGIDKEDYVFLLKLKGIEK